MKTGDLGIYTNSKIKTPVRVNPTLANQRAQYFTDWVDDQVRSLVGEPTEDLVV